MVTVRANGNILGMGLGQVATVELTPTVQTHLDQGWLKVIDAPETSADPAPVEVPETVSETPEDAIEPQTEASDTEATEATGKRRRG